MKNLQKSHSACQTSHTRILLHLLKRVILRIFGPKWKLKLVKAQQLNGGFDLIGGHQQRNGGEQEGGGWGPMVAGGSLPTLSTAAWTSWWAVMPSGFWWWKNCSVLVKSSNGPIFRPTEVPKDFAICGFCSEILLVFTFKSFIQPQIDTII